MPDNINLARYAEEIIDFFDNTFGLCGDIETMIGDKNHIMIRYKTGNESGEVLRLELTREGAENV